MSANPTTKASPLHLWSYAPLFQPSATEIFTHCLNRKGRGTPCRRTSRRQCH